MRRLMIVVAIAAVPLAVWDAWFDPVRRWQRAITDDQDGLGRYDALQEMVSGKASVDKATALATLTDALRSPSFRIRQTAVSCLGRLGPKARRAMPALLETLADPEPLVRTIAASALISVLPPGDPGRDEVAPALTRLLSDHSPYVRLQAACTLAEFGHGEDAVPILIEALRRPDYLGQGNALSFLGLIGPAAARDALPEVKALESRAATDLAPDKARFLRNRAVQTRLLLGDHTAVLADGPEAELDPRASAPMSRPSQAPNPTRLPVE